MPHVLILSVAVFGYLPFVNQALHIDSPLMVYMCNRILEDPIDPPVGEHGAHFRLHNHTKMPRHSLQHICAHPPLIPYLLAPVAMAAGNSEVAFHLASILFYLAAIYGGWGLFGLFFDRKHQILGTLLWALCPALAVNSHTVMWDIPLTALMIWSLYMFFSGLRSDSAGRIAISGVLTGCAALTKVSCFPLYPLLGGYLLLTLRGRPKARWRMLWLWALGAVGLPCVLVLHNLLVYGKIYYLSVGHFNPLWGDIRYRAEREISYIGGCIALPPLLLWLPARDKKPLLMAALCGIPAVVWSLLLLVVLKKPLLFSAAYAIFAAAGIWLIISMFRLGARRGGMNLQGHESILISVYPAMYGVILLLLHSATPRYLLPIIPFAIAAIIDRTTLLGHREHDIYWALLLPTTAVLSLLLGVADYLYCEADRRLPRDLKERGYVSENTWYYGRLSYDYYLRRAGFRNTGVVREPRQPGDWLIVERIPGDYDPRRAIRHELVPVAVDTLSYYNFPFRTMGGRYGGFHGNTRIPYSVEFGVPQRSYVVYRLDPGQQ